MIVKVWGIVNSKRIDFAPIRDQENYWEGYAPKVEGLQNIEIWAENDKGARGHLQCSVYISYHTDTTVRLTLSPFLVKVIEAYQVKTKMPIFNVEVMRRCRS